MSLAILYCQRSEQQLCCTVQSPQDLYGPRRTRSLYQPRGMGEGCWMEGGRGQVASVFMMLLAVAFDDCLPERASCLALGDVDETAELLTGVTAFGVASR